jgi:hypothetical protein
MSTFTSQPTLDELPVDAFPPIEEINPADDERNFEEILAADKQTISTREKASAFAAAFNAVMRRAGIIRACNELQLDPNEIMRLYLTLIDAAQRTEWAAEQSGAPCSKLRRFKCGMSTMELFYKRATIPPELWEKGREADRKRHTDTLSRTARKRWKKVHAVQRHLHLAFFIREKGEASTNKKTAGHFTDHLTDLIADTARRAKGKGEPVSRYNRAADEALEHFRETIPEYAPEWVAGDADAPSAKTANPKQSEEGDRWKPIKISIKKIVREALEVIREERLSEDEAFAKRAELHALLESEWSDAPSPNKPPQGKTVRAVSPSLPLVTVNADSAKNDPVSAPPESKLDRAVEPYLTSDETANSLGKTQIPSPENSGFSALPEDQAAATVEAFESVGVSRFKVVFLNVKPVSGQSDCVGSEDTDAARLRGNVARYIKRSEKQSESVCLRPQDGALIQVDDCNAETLALLQPFAFAVIETSPGSFQPFIALSPDTAKEKRKESRERLLRRLKGSGANGGAYNSVRMPGALNVKEKHKAAFGEYPRVRLVSVAHGRIVTPEELDSAGLLAPVEEKPKPLASVTHIRSSNLPDHFPDFNEHLQRKWLDSENRPDRSSAEIAWCCAALRAGFPSYMVEDELCRLSLKVKGRNDNYIQKTVRAAEQFLSTHPQTSSNDGRERMVV